MKELTQRDTERGGDIFKIPQRRIPATELDPGQIHPVNVGMLG